MRSLLNIVAVALLLTFSSCKKILEQKIYSQATASNFPQTEADVKSAFVPFYAQFGTYYFTGNPADNKLEYCINSMYDGYIYSTLTQTDEGIDDYGEPWGTFTLGPSSNFNQLSNGKSMYRKIKLVARLTDLIGFIEKSNITNKDVNIAEAKGLRAWFAFMLYDLYGPLNIILDPTKTSSSTVSPRLSEAEYIAAVEKDLKDAIAVLPDRYNSGANWGRVSKGVARMLLLKLYMMAAGRTHDASFWTKAQAVGSDLMTMGYSLQPSYKDAFTKYKNDEVIYAYPEDPNNIYFQAILNDPWDSVVVKDGVRVPVSSYAGPNKTGRTGSGGYYAVRMNWAFYDKYDPADKRLETIGSSVIDKNGNVINRAGGLKGAVPMKYVLWKPYPQGWDFVMFRYADVLLSMAEIENEINGPTGTAIGYAQQVTDRAGVSIPSGATASQSAFRDFLLDERGRELYFEPGIRRQDLNRHGKLISYAVARGIPAQDYQTLWPIPSDVIIQSNGVITQNPGYPN